MLSAYLHVSFVLPKEENDSPIIGDGFLDSYNVDYVGQPHNHRIPAIFFSSYVVMEQMQGLVYFWDSWDRVLLRTRLVTRSVCESVSGTWCLFSITLDFGVCWIIEVIFPSTQVVFILVSLVPSSAWTVVDWLLRSSLHVRSSLKTVCWSCLATTDSIATAFAPKYIPWSRPSVWFLSLVSRLTSSLSPRYRAALRSSIMRES